MNRIKNRWNVGIEDQKETEAFIFASLAAIDKAIKFVGEFGEEALYEGEEFGQEVLGLSFAGGLASASGRLPTADLLRIKAQLGNTSADLLAVVEDDDDDDGDDYTVDTIPVNV